MWRFWQFRGHLVEGSARAEQVLAMPGGDEPSPWRMRAVEAAGGLAWWSAGAPAADAFYATQVELARQIGDEKGLADALYNLSHSRFGEDPSETAALIAEAEVLYRKLGDEGQLARLYFSTGYLFLAQGYTDEVERVGRESLARFEALGDEFYIALASSALAMTVFMKGEADAAVDLAMRGFVASLAMGDTASITLGLLPTAVVFFLAGQPGDAATIHAAYEGHCHRYGVQPPLDVEGWLGMTPAIEAMLAVIADDAFVEERRVGAALTTDGIIEFLAREAVPRFKARTREAAPTGMGAGSPP
jgi:hypothetical protein